MASASRVAPLASVMASTGLLFDLAGMRTCITMTGNLLFGKGRVIRLELFVFLT